MVTHPEKRSGVALNQALELASGILPPEFESWDEVPNNYQSFRPNLMPTPTVSDQYTGSLSSTQQSDGSMHSVTLAQVVNRNDLLPTPMTTEANHGDYESEWNRHSPPLGTLVHGTDWGRFAQAIQRWEQVNGRAPKPTEPYGDEGKHRLSARFAEWMMGLQPGHVTDCDITRNEQLKACGNGVVPQQAALALKLLGAKNVIQNN
jgi:hypothetical protein